MGMERRQVQEEVMVRIRTVEVEVEGKTRYDWWILDAWDRKIAMGGGRYETEHIAQKAAKHVIREILRNKEELECECIMT